MGFCETELPWQPGVLDAGLRRSARAAVVTADQDDVRMAFGHPGGDRPHSYFRDEFNADASVVVGVFEVVDQLRQIFDRIDVMVWRR